MRAPPRLATSFRPKFFQNRGFSPRFASCSPKRIVSLYLAFAWPVGGLNIAENCPILGLQKAMITCADSLARAQMHRSHVRMQRCAVAPRRADTRESPPSVDIAARAPTGKASSQRTSPNAEAIPSPSEGGRRRRTPPRPRRMAMTRTLRMASTAAAALAAAALAEAGALHKPEALEAEDAHARARSGCPGGRLGWCLFMTCFFTCALLLRSFPSCAARVPNSDVDGPIRWDPMEGFAPGGDISTNAWGRVRPMSGDVGKFQATSAELWSDFRSHHRGEFETKFGWTYTKFGVCLAHLLWLGDGAGSDEYFDRSKFASPGSG